MLSVSDDVVSMTGFGRLDFLPVLVLNPLSLRKGERLVAGRLGLLPSIVDEISRSVVINDGDDRVHESR